MAPTCKFWLRGDCRRGSSCQFSHENHFSINQGDAIVADTGSVLETIESHDLTGVVDRNETISLTDYQFLSSYNWIDEDSPVIYVPGKHRYVSSSSFTC